MNNIQDLAKILSKAAMLRQYDPSVLMKAILFGKGNTFEDSALSLLQEMSKEGKPLELFPSEVNQGSLPFNGRENSPETLKTTFNNLAKEAVDSGEAPFSDGKDFIYRDVMANTPATASAAAMMDNDSSVVDKNELLKQIEEMSQDSTGIEDLAAQKLDNPIEDIGDTSTDDYNANVDTDSLLSALEDEFGSVPDIWKYRNKR